MAEKSQKTLARLPRGFVDRTGRGPSTLPELRRVLAAERQQGWAEEIGQVYLPAVNWFLLITVVALVIGVIMVPLVYVLMIVGAPAIAAIAGAVLRPTGSSSSCTSDGPDAPSSVNSSMVLNVYSAFVTTTQASAPRRFERSAVR